MPKIKRRSHNHRLLFNPTAERKRTALYTQTYRCFVEGMTLTKLGKLTNTSRVQVSKIFSPKWRIWPTLPRALLFAQVLDVTVEDLCLYLDIGPDDLKRIDVV